MNPELPLSEYLRPGTYLDSDHPAIRAFVATHTTASQDDQAKAVSLYYAVRDGYRYNPYILHLREADLKASAIVARKDGHCVDKASIYAAACRAVGIPSRLHFANVRNHIGTSKLEHYLQTDILAFHGYAEIWLHGRWVVATPAFNKELCAHLGVAPLEFDGETDALFQAYATRKGEAEPQRFMEYLHDHGHFPDLPKERFVEAMYAHYGHLFEPKTLQAMGMQLIR